MKNYIVYMTEDDVIALFFGTGLTPHSDNGTFGGMFDDFEKLIDNERIDVDIMTSIGYTNDKIQYKL